MKKLALLLTPALVLFACAEASEGGPNAGLPNGGKADDASVCCELVDMEADVTCCTDGEWSTQCKDGAGEICEDDDAPFDPNARGQVGDACGSLATPLCADALFCQHPPEANCGRADWGGVCAVRPDSCPEIFAPVCGCDGETYDSDCVAGAAGMSHTPGYCEGDGAPEGGICRPAIGLVCADGLLCDLAVAGTCEAQMHTIAFCVSIPQSCDDQDAPVCGCDGVTYDNPCEAHAAAQVVAADGPC